uniref:Uncharacterized protein n=1 Tax=viral metagenome TaxID=1070528 RepID=A0A6C0KGG6_9ZZZZ
MPGFSLSAQLANLCTEERAAAEVNLQALRDATRGALRDDSRIAWEYAIGNVPREPKDIAQEMMLVDAIHNKTPYGATIENDMKKTAQKLRDEYQLSWKATWNLTKKYEPTVLKLRHLQTLFPVSGGQTQQ